MICQRFYWTWAIMISDHPKTFSAIASKYGLIWSLTHRLGIWLDPGINIQHTASASLLIFLQTQFWCNSRSTLCLTTWCESAFVQGSTIFTGISIWFEVPCYPVISPFSSVEKTRKSTECTGSFSSCALLGQSWLFAGPNRQSPPSPCDAFSQLHNPATF